MAFRYLLLCWMVVWAGATRALTQPTSDWATARQQWAFQVPKDPPIPAVQDERWTKSALDHFILAKLESRGLKPAPAAEKRALIRRATFDLLGLPPTPEEVDAFLADPAPNAFAAVVERLLKSPHYGEHWGRHWLDQVRYADSVDKRQIGQPGDINESYRYRDWVVQAFNRDLPYDQFILQQFAGDLLPGPGPDGFNAEGIVATSMLAIGRWEQGEADKEKMMTDIVDDQIDVTGRTFLGLTLSCARCHDHKFDPITTRDYYALAGTFFSSHVIPEVGSKGGDTQRLRVPIDSPAELARRQQRESQMAALEKEMGRTVDEGLVARARRSWSSLAPTLMAAADYGRRTRSQPGLTVAEFMAARPQGDTMDSALVGAWARYLGLASLHPLSTLATNYMGQPALTAWLTADSSDTPWAILNRSDVEASFSGIRFPPRSVALHPGPKAGIAVRWRSPLSGTVRVTGRIVDLHASCGDGVEWELTKSDGAATTRVSSGSIPNGGAQNLAEGSGADQARALEVRAGDRVELALRPKADHACDSTGIELVIVETNGAGRAWNLAEDLTGRDAATPPTNPQGDRLGHAAIWEFDDLATATPRLTLAKDSVVTRWVRSANEGTAPTEMAAGAAEIQERLTRADADRQAVRRQRLAELERKAEVATDEELATAAKALLAGEPFRIDDPGLDQIHRDFLNPRGPFWGARRSEPALLSATIRSNLNRLQAEFARLKQNPPSAPMFAHGIREGGVPQSEYAGLHDARIQIRGRYDRLGEPAPRRVPQLFDEAGTTALSEGSGRLPLARWIASPENPLTARVMVNRLWQFHFGEGIVRTPSNYGKLGQPPTHPELLDYLARRFIESGWSIKAMHRLILLSATYQQASAADPATLRADPDNLLFGRMNRRRLTAESLRDSLLAVNGSLDRTLGGPPLTDLNNPRRTLYLMTVRSDGSSYRSLFDAADPTAIVEQRTAATVAPQALFLLNNPFALTQAETLARRVQSEALPDDRARIEWLYRRLYARPPSVREFEAGLAATAITAWEPYCQVLLCANEFLYVD